MCFDALQPVSLLAVSLCIVEAVSAVEAVGGRN